MKWEEAHNVPLGGGKAVFKTVAYALSFVNILFTYLQM